MQSPTSDEGARRAAGKTKILSKIKIDLTNYLGIEKNIDFRGQQDKVFSIISNLYSSKTNQTAMSGWLNLPHDSEMFKEINEFVSKIKSSDQYQHLLVLGIGGSVSEHRL